MEINYDLVLSLQEEAHAYIAITMDSVNSKKKWWQQKMTYEDAFRVWVYIKLSKLQKTKGNDTN